MYKKIFITCKSLSYYASMISMRNGILSVFSPVHPLTPSPPLSLLTKLAVTVILLLITATTSARAQAENVPAIHPVYDFLRRMEVQQVLTRYHGTVVPLSRKKVGEYVARVYERRDRLSGTDRDLATLYYLEFSYDRTGELRQSHSLFGSDPEDRRWSSVTSNNPKYLYAWHDTSGNSFFINGIFSYEYRSRNRTIGGIDGRSRPFLNLVDFGGRVRGTLYGRLGYYLEGANMMVKGNRVFAREDNRIVHSHSFRRSGEDFAEHSMAYVRYDAGIIGVQLGRERVVWRESLGHSLFLSDNAPMFNFLRIDVSYGAVNYNYIHGTVLFHNYREVEDNKYFVANRFEFSLSGSRFQMGINQTTMYSRAVPEIGYLIPFNILEATERNLGDRDASMIGFDIALRPFGNFEIKTGAFFDDIHFDKSFSGRWNNMWSVHAGFMYTEPFGIPDVDIVANYTRIEPHVYSHHRDPFVHHEHDGFLLGHPLGPNSDELLTRIVWRPAWQWNISVDFTRERHGDNLYDDTGELIRNVGGDVYVPWDRDRDSQYKKFLDGAVSERFHYRADVRYEVFRQLHLGGRVVYSTFTEGLTGESGSQVTLSAGVWWGL